MTSKSILVTGGAGYIGSHTVVELLQADFRVVVVDNLCNASRKSLERVQQITGKEVCFYQVNLCDRPALERVFAEEPVDAVIHFAGLKAVGESTRIPLQYYQNNLTGTLNLLEIMAARGEKRLVFSSSATVYGDPARVPITEGMPLSVTNPYGRTKLMIEDICRDLARADRSWQIALLRYFNPVGAHPSGLIGEDPMGIPNNLMPYLLQVAGGRRERLEVFGKDWPTPDGTGVRDYIHVVDLARGHLAALAALPKLEGAIEINLGTGKGYSVLEMVRGVEQASGRKIPFEFTSRRPGDIAVCYADPSLAHELLGWRATRPLEEMCRDGWRWQQQNPAGYGP